MNESVSTSALTGVRVIDLGLEQAAYCGKLLADLGADVVKIEPPSGDRGRREPPFQNDDPSLEHSLTFAYFNAGKRGITLDLETRDGQALLRSLVDTADVVLEAFAPGYLEGLGLDSETLRATRPELIVTTVTPFGQDGPHHNYLANELVSFASGGVMYLSGEQTRPPVLGPCGQASGISSLHAAAGTLMALWSRRSSGRGQVVDVSVQECLATEEHTISRYAAEDVAIQRAGSQHEAAAPGTIYRCRDGYVHLFITNSSPGIWERFLSWIGNPSALAGEEWADPMYRRAHVDEMNPHIEVFTSRHTKLELMEGGQSLHLPCAAVNTPRDFMGNPHIQARQFFELLNLPEIGDVAVAGPPFRLTKSPTRIQRAAPRLGEHNADVYCGELGLSRTELLALFQAGII